MFFLDFDPCACQCMLGSCPRFYRDAIMFFVDLVFLLGIVVLLQCILDKFLEEILAFVRYGNSEEAEILAAQVLGNLLEWHDLSDDNLEIVFRGDSLGSLVIEGLQVVDVAGVIQGLRDAGGLPGDRDPVREAR